MTAEDDLTTPLIRPYEPRDRADIYEVCVRTGASGGDATGRFSNDDLLPDIYAGPYLALEPDLALVIDTGDRVAGYLVATADTTAFFDRYRKSWLPMFSAKYALVRPPVTHEQKLVLIGNQPGSATYGSLGGYPAHFHIDLLPELQRNGLGRLLVHSLLTELRRRGVPGVQLGVGLENTGAREFYARLGFTPLPDNPANLSALGIRTDVVKASQPVG